ncbi:hypothetical protein [Elizabethkingia anophelis]|jgi:ABC-type Fe3+-hydroxamate transport system substrate-binding protein|uniref:hypothetical protein n=1 Tax=Elizabethkingia anophelis TaxID=1117645 RepID=UPI0021A5DD50|nr:hypothetical protein [Elizabethkingia anophelis]MDV4069920.1 hypothetical protein [Elizabethkingia anophelis]|tara:strand:+ start:501 stop:773 length:273 start_codon:yes stop_codon:yes gene_type:complete
MKKSFIIAAFAALIFTACNNSGKSSSENSNSDMEQSAPAINQDSMDKAHGHSHDPSGNHAPASIQDTTGKAGVQPQVNQDSIDKAHGHKH